MEVERKAFYDSDQVLHAAKAKVKEAEKRNEPIDFLTFVPDGEPILDASLGTEIDLLKKPGIEIAVITNASLLWRRDVRDDLVKADWVSLKIDAVSEQTWRKINRPHKSLKLADIMEGILNFSREFTGELVSETMLVLDVNDDDEEIERIADFVKDVGCKKSYISVPTRPPALAWVKPTTEDRMAAAYHVFKDKSIDVEYLISYEGDTFGFTGDLEADLISIASVHPMRESAVRAVLEKANADWRVIDKLVGEHKLTEVEYGGKKFFVRTFMRGN